MLPVAAVPPYKAERRRVLMARRCCRIAGYKVELIAPIATIFEEGVEALAEAVLVRARCFLERLSHIAEETAAIREILGAAGQSNSERPSFGSKTATLGLDRGSLPLCRLPRNN